MKRIPVTKASYKRINSSDSSPKGVPGVGVTVGKPDKKKERQASYLGMGTFGGFGRPTMVGASSTFYNNTYMNGGRSGGMGDVPPWIALMNEMNGGVLYYPTTLKEKYEFYRYFFRSDPYVKAAVELNTDLPLSRLILRMPKMEDKKKSKRIQKFYENMVDEIHLYEKLHSILFEYNLIGNCFPAGHFVHTPQGMLPIEQVREGDLVLTEKGTFEKVTHTMRRNASEYLYDIRIDKLSGMNFTPTGEHPVFALKDDKVVCVPAKELKEGDFVELAKTSNELNPEEPNIKIIDGRCFSSISKISKKFFNGYVYNLEVENEHTYCVNGICTHNCFLFVEYSEEKKRWDKLTILPPEEVNVANYPLSDMKMIQYRPELLISTIMKYDLNYETYDKYLDSVSMLSEEEQMTLQGVSYEFVKQIKENNGILKFDSDPYHGDGEDKIGSFVYHFAHKRHEYQDLGVSPLECVMTSLLQKTHYMFTQLSLASRNMTPRNLIMAENIPAEALDDLRDQVDQSMLSPDYAIITNYQVQWEQLGADNRLIDLQRENEVIENQIFAGLGVTRELLTGEGMYSGNKISIEILNTKYLLVRELLQRFVEESLFRPVALQNGFYEDDDEGNRTWFYPKLGFTRLTIRDNEQVFEQLFQLYQKGSLPVGMVLDLFNINSDDVDDELRKDLFTVKDATFNEMLRQMYSSMGDKLVENTDIVKQIADTIIGPQGKKLTYHGEDADEEEGGNGGSDESFGLGGEPGGGGEPAGGIDLNGLGGGGGGEEPAGAPAGEPAGEGLNLDTTGLEPSGEAPAGETPAEGTPAGGGQAEPAPAGEGSTDDKVNEYLEGITNTEGGAEEDDKAKEYLDNIVGDNDDENAEKYIDSFLGKSSSSDGGKDASEDDESQEAVLADEEPEKQNGHLDNDVGEFLTGK